MATLLAIAEPQADACSAQALGSHSAVITTEQHYLCYFLHRLLDFRIPEVESLAQGAGCHPQDVQWKAPVGGDAWSPFWYLKLPSEAVAQRIASRSLLVRGFFELWGEGSDWDELEAATLAFPYWRQEPYLGPDVRFKIRVDTYGCKLSMEQQLQHIRQLEFIKFKGVVDLQAPQVTFWLIVCDVSQNPGLPKVAPRRLYFGREVALSQRNELLAQYTLRQRVYLGPTSMDTELAFILCNQAQVRRGHFVYDPYVGTGSILVAAAARGAHTMGSDIDVRVLQFGKTHSSGRQVGVADNFEQYGLQQPLALLRMDMHTHALRAGLEEVYDAVIGDPPYGVRAGGRKTVPKDCEIRDPVTHIPSTDPYGLGECLRDLLDMAARTLTIGGHLVFFIPATPETYSEGEIPTHPALELLHNSEQTLTSRYSRRLLTMRKTRRYDAAVAAAHFAAAGDPAMALDRVHSIVYERLKDGRGHAVHAGPPNAKPRFRGKTT